jgi:hypothetical protein
MPTPTSESVPIRLPVFQVCLHQAEAWGRRVRAVTTQLCGPGGPQARTQSDGSGSLTAEVAGKSAAVLAWGMLIDAAEC